MKRILKTGLLLAFLLLCGVGAAQPPVLIHSHNDYTRTVPFYQAYAQRVSSIEADVFLRDGVLVVGHDVEDLVHEKTIEKLCVYKKLCAEYSANCKDISFDTIDEYYEKIMNAYQ